MRVFSNFFSALVAIVLFNFPATSIATTWYILPDGSGDAPTIQAGLAAATSSDTVLVAAGTYIEHDLVIYNSVNLISETEQADCVTIDAQGQGRVIICDDTNEDSLIKGFTFTGGYANGPTNEDRFGGGMYCVDGASHTTRNCVFQDNVADWQGGGVFVQEDGWPKFVDCIFTQNQASFGGAARVIAWGKATFEDCTFVENQASDGGGLYITSLGWATLTRCTFSNNTAGDEGGAISHDGAYLLLDSCVLFGNWADNWGGAMDVGDHPPLNWATPKLQNCTIAGNRAGQGKGGIRCESDLNMIQCIIAFNSHSGIDGGTPVLNCCDVFGNEGGDWIGSIAWQDGIQGNFSRDPCFCDLEGGDLTVCEHSMCLPGDHPWGCEVQVGALGQGCSGCQCPLSNTVVVEIIPEHMNAPWDLEGPNGYYSSGSGTTYIPGLEPGQYVLTWGTVPPYFVLEPDTLELPMGDAITFRGIYNRVWGVPEQVPNIEAGIDSAIAGDIVRIACGDYDEWNIHLKNGVTLRSETGDPNCVTLSGGGRGPIIRCSYVDSTTQLVGLTIAGADTIGQSIGSGIYCYNGGSPTVKDCNIINNLGREGGGIYSHNSAPRLINCLIADNTSAYRGGGIFQFEGSSKIQSCTIANNEAGSAGGGVFCNQADFNISNTIVAFNSGQAVYIHLPGETNVQCNDFFGNTGGDWVGLLEGFEGVDGNFSADPVFCDPANGDYSLCPGSPCLPENNPECELVGADVISYPAAIDFPRPSPEVRLHLAQNHPNPFNPSTTISFTLSKSGPVTLRIFDVSGRLVRTLIAGESVTAGQHERTWNGTDNSGRNVATGEYFFRVEFGGQVETRKAMLLR